MNGNLIHALLIEDNPTDADLVHEKLEVAQHVSWDLPHFEIEHVVRLKEALARLENGAFDVVLSDLDLPDSRAGETIAMLREHIPHMPLVVLTGREDEELAQKSVRAGVQDYLYKNEATGSLLARTMMYAIERQQAQAKLEQRVSERTAELRQVNRELEAEIAERKQVEGMLRERTAQLEVLQEVSAAITAQLDLEELLQNIVEEGCHLLSVQGSSLYLLDEKRGDLEQIVSYGYERNHTSTRLEPGEGLAGKVFESGEAMSVDEYHQWEGRSPKWKDELITGSLCVPLKCGGEIIGTLGFEELGEARIFDNQDIWLAKLFANQAAIAIRNAQLYEQAQHNRGQGK